MRTSALLLLCLVLALALTVAARSSPNRHLRPSPTHPSTPHEQESRVVQFTRTAAPPGWTLLREAPLSTAIRFTLVLQSRNLDVLEQRFWEVSDPDHPSYGRFMTNADIEALVAPSPADLRLLYATLALHGIDRSAVASHGDSFEVHTTVGAAASLFATRFFEFTHARSGMSAVRQMGEYSLPSPLAAHVEMVFDVHLFPTIEERINMRERREARRQASMAAAAASDNAIIVAWVPQAVSAIYQVPFPIEPLSTPWVDAGVIEWVDETFSPADLANFSTAVNISLSPVDSHRIVGNDSVVPYPGTEASLDIQWMEGINPAFTSWFWIVSDPTKWMYTFAVQFLQATDYPSVISLSYGLPEMEQCTAWPKGGTAWHSALTQHHTGLLCIATALTLSLSLSPQVTVATLVTRRTCGWSTSSG